MITSITIARITAEQYTTKKAKTTIIVLRRWLKKLRVSMAVANRMPMKILDDYTDDGDIKEISLKKMFVDEEIKKITNENLENEWREQQIHHNSV